MHEHIVDWYAVLGVAPEATAEQLKAAFRRACKRCHPDAGGTEREMIEAIAAYEVLSNPAKRAEYDRRRREHAGTQSTASQAEASYAKAREHAEAVYHAYGQDWTTLNDWLDARVGQVQANPLGRLASGAISGLLLGLAAGAGFGVYFGIGWMAGCAIGGVCGIIGGAVAVDNDPAGNTTPAA